MTTKSNVKPMAMIIHVYQKPEFKADEWDDMDYYIGTFESGPFVNFNCFDWHGHRYVRIFGRDISVNFTPIYAD